MIWMFLVFKTRWLFKVNFFFKDSIEKCCLHIHLIHNEVHIGGIGKEQSYRFNTSNMSKGFSIVNIFNLSKTLGNKFCFVPSDDPILVHLVSVYPACTN